MKFNRIAKLVGIGVVVSGAFLGIAAWIVLGWLVVRPESYSPSIEIGPVSLRTWPEHDAIYQQTSFPFVLEIDHEKGSLIYVGARHTADAADPQLAEIERRWNEFRPTVALCEGRSRLYRFSTRPTSGSLSESTLVRILAWRGGVGQYTLEPTYDAEVSGLLQHFDPKLVATFFTLRVYTTEARGYSGDKDQLALELLRKRTAVNGLRGCLRSIAELDAYWQQAFADAPDWRSLPDTESLPLLVEVGNVSRQVRGEHMVRTLVELVRRGERVFAVVGASHVIRQEPILRRLLESEAPRLGGMASHTPLVPAVLQSRQ
jgi:hypothetical protein